MQRSFVGAFEYVSFTGYYSKTSKHPLSAFLFICFFIISLSLQSDAQSNQPNPKYKLLSGQSFVQSKNYYLLTLFEELADVKELLSEYPVLSVIAKNKAAGLSLALKNCKGDRLCYTGKMKFTDEEVRNIGDCLIRLYSEDNALGKLVKNHLIPSGAYILFNNLSPKEILIKAWGQDANGINYTIGVYAEGNKPNYPIIDSISFNTRDSRNNNTFLHNYVSLLYNTASVAANECENASLFFVPSLTCALHFIEMNEREQASDFELMSNGENKAAYERIRTIKWNDYKYSQILIPGAGPEQSGVALSAEGRLRCRLGAIQYAKGTTPFIVVSGGKVHPYKTKFCEDRRTRQSLIILL